MGSGRRSPKQSARGADGIHEAARNSYGTIEVEFPDGVAPYRWAIVSADDPGEVLMTVPGTQGALIGPPGEYRVTTQVGKNIE